VQAVGDRGHTERAVPSDLGGGSSAIALFFGNEGGAGFFSAVDALDLTMTTPPRRTANCQARRQRNPW